MYFNAISLYRAGRFLERWRIPILPRVCEGLIFLLFNSSIPLACEIGSGSICGHRGIGVVISSGAKIGKNCIIRAHVVIGGGHSQGKPVIGDDVLIGVGAKILGGVHLGDGARIGANAVVIDDVPAMATAVGVPARVVQSKHSKEKPAVASRDW
jgi:serine O-acetyltransferase